MCSFTATYFIRFCTIGGLQVIVLNFKFGQNRLSGYRDVWGQNLGSCITLANGFIQPCTTVQTWRDVPIRELQAVMFHASWTKFIYFFTQSFFFDVCQLTVSWTLFLVRCLAKSCCADSLVSLENGRKYPIFHVKPQHCAIVLQCARL